MGKILLKIKILIPNYCYDQMKCNSKCPYKPKTNEPHPLFYLNTQNCSEIPIAVLSLAVEGWGDIDKTRK
jgi:hypothetical protein